MSHKLDLVPIYINRHRKLLSKWLSVNHSDLTLLAGFDLDNDVEIKYQYSPNDKFKTLNKSEIISISLTDGMRVSVKKLGNNK